MKEYIDESNIGKEVQLRAEFDSAYRQDNGVVAILLTKGIIIEKQDWFLITSIAIYRCMKIQKLSEH